MQIPAPGAVVHNQLGMPQNTCGAAMEHKGFVGIRQNSHTVFLFEEITKLALTARQMARGKRVNGPRMRPRFKPDISWTYGVKIPPKK